MSAGSTYVRAIVQGRANPWFEEYWTPLGSFGHALLAATPPTSRWQPSRPPRQRRSPGATFSPFGEEWRRVLPVAADLLDKVPSFDDLLVNTVRRVDCRRWFAGRLVLLGD